MTGMYCVLPIIEGRPGRLFEAEDWDHAVDVALAVVKDTDPGSAEITPDEEIREELKQDTCWASNQGDIWVYILMTEDFITPDDKAATVTRSDDSSPAICQASDEAPEQVCCKFCHTMVPAATAHLHDGGWVGDVCCWDERLRSTE
jgi:hypothetical protein